MARRRRKRSSSNAPSSLAQGERLTQDDLLDPASAGPAASTADEERRDGAIDDSHEHVHAEQTCLIHMGHETVMTCDDCQTPMCEVCAFPIGAVTVCGDCASSRVREPRHAQTPWRGWASMALGLVAVGASRSAQKW